MGIPLLLFLTVSKEIFYLWNICYATNVEKIDVGNRTLFGNDPSVHPQQLGRIICSLCIYIYIYAYCISGFSFQFIIITLDTRETSHLSEKSKEKAG